MAFAFQIFSVAHMGSLGMYSKVLGGYSKKSKNMSGILEVARTRGKSIEKPNQKNT